MTHTTTVDTSRLFTGLSAFSLTPVSDKADAAIDEAASTRLVSRLATAQVNSITILGSTGNYAYLTSEERQRVVQLPVAEAGCTLAKATASPMLARADASMTYKVNSGVEAKQVSQLTQLTGANAQVPSRV